MASKFLDPHDVEPIPGTEGWEGCILITTNSLVMTPSGPSMKAISSGTMTACTIPSPIHLLTSSGDEAWFLALSQNNTRTFLVPPAKGIEHRIVNGYVFITPIGIADPKEIEARVPIFMKRAGYYYDNWDTLYVEWEARMKGLLNDLEAVSFQPLPEIEDESMVFEKEEPAVAIISLPNMTSSLAWALNVGNTILRC